MSKVVAYFTIPNVNATIRALSFDGFGVWEVIKPLAMTHDRGLHEKVIHLDLILGSIMKTSSR